MRYDVEELTRPTGQKVGQRKKMSIQVNIGFIARNREAEACYENGTVCGVRFRLSWMSFVISILPGICPGDTQIIKHFSLDKIKTWAPSRPAINLSIARRGPLWDSPKPYAQERNKSISIFEDRNLVHRPVIPCS